MRTVDLRWRDLCYSLMLAGHRHPQSLAQRLLREANAKRLPGTKSVWRFKLKQTKGWKGPL